MYNLSAKYSLAETYCQLGKYELGLKTLDLIPEKFTLTEDETIEHLNYVSLFTFKNKIRESGRAIAQLNEAEIEQLLYFATASTGLSSVKARGILCFFYEICLEVEPMRGLDNEMMRRCEDETMNAESGKQNAESKKQKAESGNDKKNSYGPTVLHSYGLENITVIPNPTTGELRIENGGLRIENIEVYDIYGRNVSNLISQISNQTINISHLQIGIYFVKVTTEQGEVIKKIVKK
jgi:hypothetical protein